MCLSLLERLVTAVHDQISPLPLSFSISDRHRSYFILPLSEKMRVVDVNVCMCLAPVMDRYDFSEKFQMLGPGAN